MNARSRIRLMLGIFIVLIIMASLVVYVDHDRSHIQANQAAITIETYNVGLDYSGFITRSFIEIGDEISEGDTLFYVQSNMLMERLDDDSLQRNQLTYEMNQDNEIILSANKDGVVSRVDYAEGSFIAANTEIASISTSSDEVYASATFELSRRDFGKVQRISTIEVTLPDGTRAVGNIININVHEQNDEVLTQIKARLMNVDIMPFMTDGETPVEARITVNEQTFYRRLNSTFQTFTNRIWE